MSHAAVARASLLVVVFSVCYRVNAADIPGSAPSVSSTTRYMQVDSARAPDISKGPTSASASEVPTFAPQNKSGVTAFTSNKKAASPSFRRHRIRTMQLPSSISATPTTSAK
jgi:hypothetical protein